MSLSRDDQRFLFHDYGWRSAAQLLAAGGIASAKQGMYGGMGPSRASFSTVSSRGIGYTWPDEERPGLPGWNSHQHWITWAQLSNHRNSQPQHVRDQLDAAHNAEVAEARQHWEAMTEIAPNWYWKADPDTRARLDAEWDRSLQADRLLSSATRDAIEAMLPLAADDGPADLIEWAAILA